MNKLLCIKKYILIAVDHISFISPIIRPNRVLDKFFNPPTTPPSDMFLRNNRKHLYLTRLTTYKNLSPKNIMRKFKISKQLNNEMQGWNCVEILNF